MNDSKDWYEYLEERPGFRTWYEYRLESAIGTSTSDLNACENEHNMFIDAMGMDYVFSKAHLYGKLSGLPGFRPMTVLRNSCLAPTICGNLVDMCHDIEEHNAEGRRLLRLDDDGAITESIVRGHFRKLVGNLIVDHHCPNISIAEAEHVGSAEDYILVLCRRAKVDRITYNDVYTIMRILNWSVALSRPLWSDMDTFIRSICKYSHAYWFENSYVSMNMDRTIDRAYLDSVMLTNKSEPSDISSKDWHDMAVLFTDEFNKTFKEKTDQCIAETIEDMDDPSVSDDFGLAYWMTGAFMVAALTPISSQFIGRGMDELVFAETISDFLDLNNRHKIEEEFTHVEVDPYEYTINDLEPKLFDMLREYGPAFVSPLFTNAMENLVHSDGVIDS